MQGAAISSLGVSVLFDPCGSFSGASPSTGAVAASQSLKAIRIKRVETFKVVVPMKPGTVLSEDAADLEPFWHDFQKGNPEAPKYIIKLFSDDGLVGIGERFRGADAAAVSKNAQSLIGRNILELDFADSSPGAARRKYF